MLEKNDYDACLFTLYLCTITLIFDLIVLCENKIEKENKNIMIHFAALPTQPKTAQYILALLHHIPTPIRNNTPRGASRFVVHSHHIL